MTDSIGSAWDGSSRREFLELAAADAVAPGFSGTRSGCFIAVSDAHHDVKR
jgi:hypothetical protein